MNQTTWSTDIALEALRLVGPEIAQAYFEMCAERGIAPDPVELAGSYEGLVIEVDVKGVATKRHRFDV